MGEGKLFRQRQQDSLSDSWKALNLSDHDKAPILESLIALIPGISYYDSS